MSHDGHKNSLFGVNKKPDSDVVNHSHFLMFAIEKALVIYFILIF